jgi:hypothetical protein
MKSNVEELKKRLKCDGGILPNGPRRQSTNQTNDSIAAAVEQEIPV